MKKFITEIILAGDSDPQIFSEGAIKIRVEDDGGGRYLSIQDAGGESEVKLNFTEIDELMAACKELIQ